MALAGPLICHDLRRGGAASGVANCRLSLASLGAKLGLTWAFAWQVLDSNQGRLTSTVLQTITFLTNAPFWPAKTQQL